MQSSRSGRKLNQAVQNTSRAVASTGKVVGMFENNLYSFPVNFNYHCKLLQLIINKNLFI